MKLAHDLLNRPCVIRFSLQSLIQVSRIQANPLFLVHRVSLTAGVSWNLAGVSWNLLLHDYKAVDPFCHIFGLFKDSQLFQIPDFFVKSILQMYRHFPRCMSSGLCIWLEFGICMAFLETSLFQ